MGAADIIPGVSGGTVALILGIYQRLVTAISHFDLTFVGFLRSGKVGEAAVHVDLRFLVLLGIGIATGVLGLAGTMHFLLEHHTQRTLAAFFGMILASAFVVGRTVGGWNPPRLAALAIGIVFAYWLVGLPFLDDPPEGNGWLFFCGVVAICAMILPGISGAFILLILGEYYEITGVLKSIGSGELTAEGIETIVTFAAGATVGLLAFSKVLRVLLEAARGVTMAVLAGFMLGSLRKIWPFRHELTPLESDFRDKQFENVWPSLDAAETWFVTLILLGAAAFVLALERASAQRARAGTG